MRTLFIYPEFPKTFWSYEKILELVNRKVLLPPLGLVTVAALLPQTWDMKLVDRNVREVTEAEWSWAELVVISGMIVQKADMAAQIAKAKVRDLPVAVGGPFASSTPVHRGDRARRPLGPLQLQRRKTGCDGHSDPPLRPARTRSL
jgi:radical SAM superfamily enzyme YgiQ (UPF0313 family)